MATKTAKKAASVRKVGARTKVATITSPNTGFLGVYPKTSIIKGEEVVVIPKDVWEKVQVQVVKLQKKEAKLKVLETVGNRLKAAAKQVIEVESGKRKPKTLNSLITQLRKKK